MYLYQLRDMQTMLLAPYRFWALAAMRALEGPYASLWLPPFLIEEWRARAAFIEQAGRPLTPAPFGIAQTKFRSRPVKVSETAVHEHPFCRLVRFDREADDEAVNAHMKGDPSVLVVAPLSGHFASLLRGTIEAMLPAHNVYITDWIDAKKVPLANGAFDLEDQIAYLADMVRLLGPDLHVLAVHQASFAALAAVAFLAGRKDPAQPRSLTLLGGPIDAARGYVALREMALARGLSWFKHNHIQLVPSYYPGGLRPVYPGFSQVQDRMALSLGQGMDETAKYFQHLVRGDEDDATAHERLYDAFLSVMDVPAENHLCFIEAAFEKCALANGTLTVKGEKVDPAAIRKTALLTVEGELDELSPAGQTRAALDLCAGLPDMMKQAHLEIGVGHYGIFSGKKWRNNIQPIVHAFIRTHSQDVDEVSEE